MTQKQRLRYRKSPQGIIAAPVPVFAPPQVSYEDLIQASKHFQDFKPVNVLHVGAHVGEEAKWYASIGVQLVVWFEANPYVLTELAKNLNGLPNKNYIVYGTAFDVPGLDIALNVTNNGMSSSILAMGEHQYRYPHIRYVESVLTKTVTVDEIVSAQFKDIEFDFLNIDVQGAEDRVLKGMSRTIETINWIYSEVNFIEMYKGCVMLGELDLDLNRKGFDRVKIHDTGLGWGDAMYKRIIQ
jgi:FkbM family methyltransferase